MVESRTSEGAGCSDEAVSPLKKENNNNSQLSSSEHQTPTHVGHKSSTISGKAGNPAAAAGYSKIQLSGAKYTAPAVERRQSYEEVVQNVHVIYKIETIFVMDEKPFEQQRQKKLTLNVPGIQQIAQTSSKDKSAEKDSIAKSEIEVEMAPNGVRSTATDSELKHVKGIVAQLQAVDQDSQLALAIKQRTNSSVLQTTTPNNSGKLLKEKSQRKKSMDQKRSLQDTSATSTTQTAKNLLDEFEKDETLEPNMQLFSDGKSKLVNGEDLNRRTSFEAPLLLDDLQQQQSGSQLDLNVQIETRQNNLQRPKEAMSIAAREAYQARRITEQAPRKNAGYDSKGQARIVTRNVDKTQKVVVEETKNAQTVRQQITLSNKKHGDVDETLASASESHNPAKSVNALVKLDSPRRASLLEQFSSKNFFEGQPELRVRFTEVVRKFNHELMKSTCQVMKGCKSWTAKQIAGSVFELLNEILQHINTRQSVAKSVAGSIDSIEQQQKMKKLDSVSSGQLAAQRQNNQSRFTTPHKSSVESCSLHDDSNLNQTSGQQVRVVKQITTSVSTLKGILNYCFQMSNYHKPDCLKDFLVASLLMQSKINVIVLLAGTSGTGKSTLASLLGTRLGISTVLSTDSVRHVMRNFMKEEDNPTLFCSTYEAGKTVSQEERQNASENWVTLKGYKQQCALVTKELAKVIDSFYKSNQSIVVEGVHLTMNFVKEMMSRYPTCIPFVLYIKNKNKHGERFAVRAKHMTIDPRFNKYISNIQHIRTIQEYLLKKSEEILIPRIENHNVDRSVSLIQATIMRCLHRISEGGLIYDTQQKRATGIHNALQSIQKHQLSSKKAQLLIHEKVNDPVNRVKMVETFLQRQAELQGHVDPEFARKLGRHRLSASFDAKTINIWKYGVFADGQGGRNEDSDDEGGAKKRAISIVNVLPVLNAAADPNQPASQAAYEKLSKAEKKQIKRELKEFSKQTTQRKNKIEQRKNLIETEEDLEAKICEGSQASSILKDHRKKNKMQVNLMALSRAVSSQEVTAGGEFKTVDTSTQNNMIIDMDVSLYLTPQNKNSMEIPRTVTNNAYEVDEIAAAVLLQPLMLELAEDADQKLQAKRLVSDQQKQNEMNLLKEAVRRAEEQQMKEDTQQMKDEVKEAQKKHRNKSQEPAGKGEQDAPPSDAGDMSQGSSLEVLADDEDDEDRLREITEVEKELNLLKKTTTNNPFAITKDEVDSKLLYGGDNQKLIQAQMQQLGNIQQVNLARIGKMDASPENTEEKTVVDAATNVQQKKKNISGKYKLEAAQAGSADNLIQMAEKQLKQQQKEQKLSGFAIKRQTQQRQSIHDTNMYVKKAEKKLTQSSKRTKLGRDSKRQSSHQQNNENQHSQAEAPRVERPRNQGQGTTTYTTKAMRSKDIQKMQSFQGGDKQGEEEKCKEKATMKDLMRKVSVDKQSFNSGSNLAVNSTRGDAHSQHHGGEEVSEEGETYVADAHQEGNSAPRQKRKSGHHGQLNKQQLTQASHEDQHSGYGERRTIEEEDSEYSQTIGSLVSYTINYMENKTIRGAGCQSSRHDNEGRDVGHTDSESDDHSLIAEKEEESHSSIDTIEEEVDLSSEGSDHDDHQQEELEKQQQQQQQQQLASERPQVAQSIEVLESVPSASPGKTTQAEAD